MPTAMHMIEAAAMWYRTWATTLSALTPSLRHRSIPVSTFGATALVLYPSIRIWCLAFGAVYVCNLSQRLNSFLASSPWQVWCARTRSFTSNLINSSAKAAQQDTCSTAASTPLQVRSRPGRWKRHVYPRPHSFEIESVNDGRGPAAGQASRSLARPLQRVAGLDLWWAQRSILVIAVGHSRTHEHTYATRRYIPRSRAQPAVVMTAVVHGALIAVGGRMDRIILQLTAGWRCSASAHQAELGVMPLLQGCPLATA